MKSVKHKRTVLEGPSKQRRARKAEWTWLQVHPPNVSLTASVRLTANVRLTVNIRLTANVRLTAKVRPTANVRFTAKCLIYRKSDPRAPPSLLLRVAGFKPFMFSQPSLFRDKGWTKLDKRFDGSATPGGRRVGARVSALSVPSSLSAPPAAISTTFETTSVNEMKSRHSFEKNQSRIWPTVSWRISLAYAYSQQEFINL